MTSPDQYNPNVPENPSDSLASTQNPFLINFGQLFDVFSKNHVNLDAGATAGNHTIIQLIQQKNSQQTNIGEISVFSKNVEDTTDQIFLKYQNGDEFQLSCYQIYQLTPFPNKLLQYITFLPGRILIYFGVIIPSTFPDKTLQLFPPIAKNIISVSTCPVNTGNALPSIQWYKPWVSLKKSSDDKFFTGITFNSVSAGIAVPQVYYLVMANI